MLYIGIAAIATWAVLALVYVVILIKLEFTDFTMEL